MEKFCDSVEGKRAEIVQSGEQKESSRETSQYLEGTYKGAVVVLLQGHVVMGQRVMN